MYTNKKKFIFASSNLGRGIKTKNAFTLIELLAIIVILAIIAVITVPIILNVIDESKKGAVKDSAYGYKNAIESYYATEIMNEPELKFEGEYSITTDGKITDGTNTYDINMSGQTPTGGYLEYENNTLKNGCITIDEYAVTIQDGEATTIVKGVCEIPVYKIINQKTENTLTTGDEIAIKTEHFYVLSSNENETVLLAKYNLFVGNIYDGESKNIIKLLSEEDKGYGMQNENSRGSLKDKNERIGLVSFSNSNYWSEQVGDGLTYSGDYNYPNYPYVYDNNSNLYNYIENYKNQLESFGSNIQDARMLTYIEADQLGCKNFRCPTGTEENSFISETSFFIGSAYGVDGVWGIYSAGNIINTCKFSDTTFGGVRPVIVINTSDIL